MVGGPCLPMAPYRFPCLISSTARMLPIARCRDSGTRRGRTPWCRSVDERFAKIYLPWKNSLAVSHRQTRRPAEPPRRNAVRKWSADDQLAKIISLLPVGMSGCTTPMTCLRPSIAAAQRMFSIPAGHRAIDTRYDRRIRSSRPPPARRTYRC